MTDVQMVVIQPGGQVVEIEMPDDVAMGELMSDFITALGLPISGSDGMPVSYRLHSKHLSRELSFADTLRSAAVPVNSTLIIAPHAVAGAVNP